ncbi:leucine carboxyl methyltransferase [Rickenella mellea]|uniref:Leucine carboxyl methyltransferase 1 n=1 Tax=Rickenella mellea TaxID=50990 RepID=A0A4Y7PT69_9AGAM|nr:leucine carboxyl methyltransferase [Rickenella mellea]
MHASRQPFGSSRPPQDSDEPIRLTDSDAALARLSAVQKHYLADPFIRHFVPRAHLQSARPPLINIGTYVRSESIDWLVNTWIDMSKAEGKKCQIVSLGAGSDTRFWRIAASHRIADVAKYIELDFPEITTKKAMVIRKSKDIGGMLSNITVGSGGTTLHSDVYNLLATDLRHPPSSSLSPPLLNMLDKSLPTLLLFECVLVYMTPSASSSVIQWFVDYFDDSAPLGGIVYEMFGLEDSFGKVMKNNLMMRNVELPGAEPYPTKESLLQRFLAHRFTSAQALTLREIRNAYVPRGELERISHLEMLDEIEELNLVLDHYAITWGFKGQDGDGQWTNWGLQKEATVG